MVNLHKIGSLSVSGSVIYNIIWIPDILFSTPLPPPFCLISSMDGYQAYNDQVYSFSSLSVTLPIGNMCQNDNSYNYLVIFVFYYILLFYLFFNSFSVFVNLIINLTSYQYHSIIPMHYCHST